MIRGSVKVFALVVGVSGAAHLSALIALHPSQTVLIEGGAPVSLASFGNSFRDVSLGSLAPNEAEHVLDTPAPEPVRSPLPPQELANPTQSEPQVKVEQPQKSLALSVSSPPVLDAVIPMAALKPMEPPARSPNLEPIAALKPALAKPTPAAEPDVLKAQPHETEAQVQVSLRPMTRPETLQIPRPSSQKVAKTRKKTAPQGNGARNEKVGAARGAKVAAKAGSQAKGGKVSQQSGNASLSNWRGQVLRKLTRNKPRTSLRGSARVSFSVTSSGGVSQLRIVKSSGSSQLDQLVLRAVRRSAPFPKPVPGKSSAVSVTMKGR